MKPMSAKQLVRLKSTQDQRLADRINPQMQCVIIGSALGDSEFFPITTLNEASAAFRAFCDGHGLGARDAGDCQIWSDNKVVAHVSYNGRVWEGETWVSGAKPIFDPSEVCAA